MLLNVADQFIQTSAGMVTVSLVSASILAMASATIKLMLDVSSLKQSIREIGRDIAAMNADTDIMKWSTYHRRGRSGRNDASGGEGER
jgi:hypothetical protein